MLAKLKSLSVKFWTTWGRWKYTPTAWWQPYCSNLLFILVIGLTCIFVYPVTLLVGGALYIFIGVVYFLVTGERFG